MNKIKLIGIDLAKRCYQVCAIDEHNKVLYNRKYTAKKFAEAIVQLVEGIGVRFDLLTYWQDSLDRWRARV